MMMYIITFAQVHGCCW